MKVLQTQLDLATNRPEAESATRSVNAPIYKQTKALLVNGLCTLSVF